MNLSKEEKNEELNKDLIMDDFQNENKLNSSNSSNSFQNHSADNIYRSEIYNAKQKIQYHNIYFALFYLISVFIVGISCVYYFSYNNYNNRVFLKSYKNIVNENYPFYKIVSKYTKGNLIYIKLELKESSNDNNIKKNIESGMEQIKNLDVIFEFFSDTVNFKIFSPETNSNLDEDKIYNTNEAEYSNINKKINNYKDSNINITFSHYPFNFYLQRKDDGAVLFDSNCGFNSKNQFFYSKNFIQLCTKTDEEVYFFGLGDDNINRGINLLLGKGQKFNLYSNTSDIMPFILGYNKYNLTSYGILMLNSGPIRVKILMDEISINFVSGIINIYVFGGPSVKQVILETQNIFGLPMLPHYNSIDWNFLQKETNIIEINNLINLDEIFERNNPLMNYFDCDIINFNKYKKDNNDKKLYSVFLDSIIYSKDLKDFNKYNNLFSNPPEQSIKNNFLLNNINTIGLQESKFYSNFLSENSEKNSRILLFSSRGFIDSNTLSYKLIKDVPFSLDGIKIAMRKLKSQTLFGNPFCYIQFDKNTFEQNKNNEEIVLRWSQFLSILPFAGMDNFNSDIPMPTFIRNFRYIFSLYIYVYFLNIANEGGTYFRPIFFDLKSINRNEDLISKRYEIMLGSNLLISPVSNGNCTNMSLFFPEEKFYDFYTGNQINKEGEGYYTIFLKKDELPLFLRGGKITPVQLMDKYYDVYINNNNNLNGYNIADNEILSMEKMKSKPLQLLIALDNNLQAQGRILLDDFNSNDSKKKKNYYKMTITVSQRTSDISIFFRMYSFKYNLPNDLFKNCINRLIIYGFTKLSIKKITIMNKNERVELDRAKLIFSQTSDILTIPNINIPLNMDTKILIN